ncbi:MAG: hypothetical protein GEU71_15080 [Actinobacteria bacterium]|nr:hypothetical protein [Actinomycetota bacterium]
MITLFNESSQAEPPICADGLDETQLEAIIAQPNDYYLEIGNEDTGGFLKSQLWAEGDAPDPSEGCDNSDSRSYGDLPIGTWLRELLLSEGSPQGDPLESSDIQDVGSSLQLKGSTSGPPMWMYVTAQNPADLSKDEGIRTEHVSVIRGFEITHLTVANGSFDGYNASNGQWELSIIAYGGAEGITPKLSSDQTLDWFDAALGYADTSPPPSCA